MKMVLKMGKEQYFINQVVCIKDNLKIIINKVLDVSFILITQFIEANLGKVKGKEKVDFNGKMDKFMMANGKII